MKEFSVEIEIRFRDIDAYGHVNNAVFFTYLEVARTKVFKQHFHELMQQGILYLVVKAECEYKMPIKFTDKVIISMRITDIGHSSFTIEYKIHNGNEKLFATAKTVMVTYDSKKNKPTKIPDTFFELIS